MKYELNTWYHYDEAAKKHFERWAPVESVATGRLIIACKKYDEELDKFFVRLYFDCWYDSGGVFRHIENHPSAFEGRVYGRPIAFMLLLPKYMPLEDFMKGVKHA